MGKKGNKKSYKKYKYNEAPYKTRSDDFIDDVPFDFDFYSDALRDLNNIRETHKDDISIFYDIDMDEYFKMIKEIITKIIPLTIDIYCDQTPFRKTNITYNLYIHKIRKNYSSIHINNSLMMYVGYTQPIFDYIQNNNFKYYSTEDIILK
jgi:hypothetical protein